MSEKCRLIGVCISKIQDEGRFWMIKALNEYACKSNFRLLIFNSSSTLAEQGNKSDSGESAVFRLIPYDKLSAMILFPEFIKDEAIIRKIADECISRRIPVISMEKKLDGCVCFSFDHSNVFEKLCDHIIQDHGAKKLFMMAGMRNNSFSDERVAVFRKALENNGIPYDNSLVGYGEFWEGPTIDTLVQWFEKEKRDIPDAIICTNDTMAIVASTYLQKKGYHIPEDCIITGFDGILHTECYVPHITTCKQNHNKLAQLSIETIEKMLSGEPYETDNVVDFCIVRSQSCGCMPIAPENQNESVQMILGRLWHTMQNHEMMCDIQSAIANISSLPELPSILIEKFVFNTLVFAVNNDLFTAPGFGKHHHEEASFSSDISVLYHQYNWNLCEPCTISLEQLIPEMDMMLESERPIIFCSIHWLELVLGYCVFQPDITFDDYEKINMYMGTVNSSFGTMHSKAQIEYANKELKNLYIHDHMTGLLNRRGFYRLLQKLIDSSEKGSTSIVIISADLDGLKYINDTFGHFEGDNAISEAARALLANTSNMDICARFGGDEFVVAALVPEGTEKQYFIKFKNGFLKKLAEYNSSSGKAYQIGSSIGFFAEKLTADFDMEKMLQLADKQMYADKAARKKERNN